MTNNACSAKRLLVVIWFGFLVFLLTGGVVLALAIIGASFWVAALVIAELFAELYS